MASRLTSATRPWSRATLRRCLSRLPEPFVIRPRRRCAFFKRRMACPSGFPFGTTVPSDRVASALIPRSTPTAPFFGGTGAGFAGGSSTVSDAYQRPDHSLTVMRRTRLPPTRDATSSMQWTRPIRGSLNARGSPGTRPNEPVVYANAGRDARRDLNRGNPTLRPLRLPCRESDQFFNAPARHSRPYE
jgi:hypothetical protein